MKKLLLPILAVIFIIVNEIAPFFYQEDYTVADVSWFWIIGAIVMLFISIGYAKKQEKQENQEQN